MKSIRNFDSLSVIVSTIFQIALIVSFMLISAIVMSAQKPSKPKPSVIKSIKLDQTELVLPCPREYECCGPESSDSLIVNVEITSEQLSKKSRYVYSVTGGKVRGFGLKAKWDLSNMHPGTYQITVFDASIKEDLRFITTASANVHQAIHNCDCLGCPQIKINVTNRRIGLGDTVSVSAAISGGAQNITLNWTLSAGQIISGQGTEAIQMRVPSHIPRAQIIV